MFQKMAVARPNLAVSMRFLHMLPLKRSKTSRNSHFCGKVAVSQKTEGGPLDPPSVYDVVQNTSVFEGLKHVFLRKQTKIRIGLKMFDLT